MGERGLGLIAALGLWVLILATAPASFLVILAVMILLDGLSIPRRG